MKLPETAVRIKKNPSWKASAKAALTLGLWNAPMSFCMSVGPSFLAIFLTIGTAVMSLLVWILMELSTLVFGLAGYITIEPVASKKDEEV